MALSVEIFWVGLYLTMLLLLGLRRRPARKKNKDSREEFYLASKDLGPLETSATIGATVVGGSATVVTAALVYSYGPYGLVADLAGAAGLLVLGLSLSRKVWSSRAHSLPNMLERSFGRGLGRVSSLLLIVTEVGWIALLIKATEGVLIALNFYPEQALLVSTIIFILYTSIGGQRVVALTDIFQISLVFLALSLAAGRSVLTHLPLRGTATMPPSLFITLLFTMFLSHIIGPDIYSKIFSSRDPKSASIGALGGGIVKLLVALLVFVMVSGSAAHVKNGEGVLPELGAALLPSPLIGLFLAALLAIMMSSADSCLISASTMLEWDILQKELPQWTRTLMVCILGIAGYFITLSAGSIISLLMLSYGLFTSSLVLPILFGLILPPGKLDRKMALASALVGSSSFILLTILKALGRLSTEPLLITLPVALVPLLISLRKNSNLK